MDKTYAMKWAKALESGKYRQARSALKNALPGKHVGYCCLGVAELLYGSSKEHLETDEVLSEKLRKKMKMFSPNGLLRGEKYFYVNDKGYMSLASANDCGVKFKDIAKVIRENWKNL